MSAARIISQAAVQLLVSNPGAKLPVKLSLKATVGANGQPTVVSVVANGIVASTLGVTITETANDSGIYDVTFPAGKALDVGSINVNVLPNVLATGSERRHVAIDKTAANTSGGILGTTLGRFRFNTTPVNSTTVTAPVSGSEIHANWWVDYS